MKNNEEKQIIQQVHNPFTGKMMKANTYSGKELMWEKGEKDPFKAEKGT
ncbi:hypothetical protein [Pseudalkalibacillus caeni]|nr:hypothetical protein [Pseudalkalibacillus caeni]